MPYALIEAKFRKKVIYSLSDLQKVQYATFVMCSHLLTIEKEIETSIDEALKAETATPNDKVEFGSKFAHKKTDRQRVCVV